MFENSSENENLLKLLRNKKNLTQNELANLAGISQSTLVKLENGTRKISKELDISLSKILEVTTLIENQVLETKIIMDRMLAYKERNKLSNKELASKARIDASLLSRIYNGNREPSKKLQKKMVDFLYEEDRATMIKQENGSFDFPKIDKREMGRRIKEIRNNREETLQKFGQKFTYPVGKNVISRWEKGINIPAVEKLMNIAYLGKTTVTFLLYGETYSNMLKNNIKVLDFDKLDPNREIGLRFRKIRTDYYLSSENFGKLFSPSITKWSINRYENGKDIPNTDRIIQYAYIGGVSLEFLVYGF